MIIEGLTAVAIVKGATGLGVAGFANGLWGAMKASELDERTLKKFARAFEKNEEARQMIAEKEALLDKRLMNVVKKKRAIISISVPQFVEVYSKIQKLNIQISEELPSLFKDLPEDKKQTVAGLVMSYQKPFTDTELICGILNPFTGGLGGTFIKDSERFASAARNQLSEANVIYSQAETICTVYDAIIERADRLSLLLAQLNYLFLKVIESTRVVIEENGLDTTKYSKQDKSILMTCVNFAAAVADLFHVSVITKEGQLIEESRQAIECGESYLLKMQKIINEEEV